MSDDRRRPGQHASRRDEALRRWIADEVHPFCAPVRAQLDRSGLGRRGLTSADDLSRLPVTELGELGDGRRHVLEPDAERIRESGDLELRTKLLVADVLGRRDGFARREVDGPYKPVRWTADRHAGGILHTGATSTDLDQLAVLGRRALAVNGITAGDRLVCLGPAAGIGPLQLELGARDAGVAHLVLPGVDPEVLASAAPTVVAGGAVDLGRAIDAGLPDSVRMLVVHVGAGGDDLAGLRARSGRPLRLWWAPAGVRAAWTTCEADQLHTWPEHEHLEVVDEQGMPAGSGRLVWSAVGWRGSVWLRVALGPEGRVDRTTCSCGRTTGRVLGPARVRRRSAAAAVAR